MSLLYHFVLLLGGLAQRDWGLARLVSLDSTFGKTTNLRETVCDNWHGHEVSVYNLGSNGIIGNNLQSAFFLPRSVLVIVGLEVSLASAYSGLRGWWRKQTSHTRQSLSTLCGNKCRDMKPTLWRSWRPGGEEITGEGKTEGAGLRKERRGGGTVPKKLSFFFQRVGSYNSWRVSKNGINLIPIEPWPHASTCIIYCVTVGITQGGRTHYCPCFYLVDKKLSHGLVTDMLQGTPVVSGGSHV